jgi:uncharacterized protein with PIN domain
VLSVHEIDRRGYQDEDQLRFSTSEQRILITRNRDDFLRLSLSFFQTGELHAGILIVPRSLPNHLPERIAHALRRWQQERPGDPGPYFTDFLAT